MTSMPAHPAVITRYRPDPPPSTARVIRNVVLPTSVFVGLVSGWLLQSGADPSPGGLVFALFALGAASLFFLGTVAFLACISLVTPDSDSLKNEAATSIEVALSRSQAFELVAETLSRERFVGNLESGGELSMRTPFSLGSFGERVTVSFTEIAPHRTRIEIVSRSPFASMIVHSRNNSNNVTRALTLVSHRVASAHELERQVSSAGAARLTHAEQHLTQLTAQFEAHFLFNTLANIRSTLEREPHHAGQMLDALVDYLRASSSLLGAPRSTLARELTLVRNYFDLMQIRFGDRVQFAIEAPLELLQCDCMPAVVMPLVENAVKHGLEPKVEGGSVTISAHDDPNSLVIEVADTGRGFVETSGTGTGLINLRDRIARYYGAKKATLSLLTNGSGGVTATLTLPKI